MALLRLENSSKRVLLNKEDLKRFGRFRWFLSTNGYAQRPSKRSNVFLHREILKCPPSLEVDHKNREKLDNRRRNLRIVTRKMNMLNRGLQKNNSSGFKGVTFQQGSWKAQLGVNGKHICLGCYKSKQQAAKAYNRAVLKRYGRIAWINKI